MPSQSGAVSVKFQTQPGLILPLTFPLLQWEPAATSVSECIVIRVSLNIAQLTQAILLQIKRIENRHNRIQVQVQASGPGSFRFRSKFRPL